MGKGLSEMKEQVRFAVGAAAMVLAACCLMGAVLTAWLRCAAGAVAQAVGWVVMQPWEERSQQMTTGQVSAENTSRSPRAERSGSRIQAGNAVDRAEPEPPPGTEQECRQKDADL